MYRISNIRKLLNIRLPTIVDNMDTNLSRADIAIEDWKEKSIKCVQNKIKEGESPYTIRGSSISHLLLNK